MQLSLTLLIKTLQMNEYENIAFTQDGITIKLFQQVNKPLTVPDTPHKHIANK